MERLVSTYRFFYYSGEGRKNQSVLAKRGTSLYNRVHPKFRRRERGDAYEIRFLECERPAGLPEKGFLDFYRQEAPDFCCLQETKMEQGQADVELNEGVLEFWNSAEKKGYSGTAVFTPHQPVAVAYGMDKDRHDHEGRLITLEYEGFYLVCCYTPNSQDGLKRLDYRMEWEDDLRDYLMSLDRHKPVVYCGDLNVAHREIDLKTQRPTGTTPASPTRSGKR